MEEGILAFDRDGAWTNTYRLSYSSARYFYSAFGRSLNQLHQKEKALYKTEEPSFEEHECVISETSKERSACLREAAACLLFSCMAIEAFLNYYGVRRLGEPFFKRNVERIGITEKLAVVVAACCKKRMDENDTLPRAVRRLFDKRNSLVHPKTKDIEHHPIEEFISEYPSDYPVGTYIETLEKFLAFMKEIDPSIPDAELR